MAVGGIVLFAYEDRFASTNWIGIILSLGSAIGAALYKVLGKPNISCYSEMCVLC